jgi:flavodoxin
MTENNRRMVNGMEKCMIAYFSWGGNTEVIARKVQEITRGDMFRIVAVKPYPDGYHETTEVAKNELRSNARPELTDEVRDIEAYDVFFLGYPNWWGTIPMAVCTFLESYDLSGKKIIPFCTHGGGGIGQSVEDIRKLCPESNVEGAKAFYGSTGNETTPEVERWLNSLALKS